MENIGGSLGFRATLNIDDFQVSAQAMERQIRTFSNNAVSEVGEVEDSIRRMAEKAGQYISYYLVGQGMKSLVNSIIQTRGQFQQLEIAFETMLGSQDKANSLMKQMVDTAAKTPFDLMGVAEGAKQLMAYGISADKVNDTLVRLGNIASGLSIPLNDIVYLYGTTMVQGRLYAQDVRQFTGRGIPLVKELAEKYHKTTDEINAMVSAGKIGFADVEEVLNKMTNAGGQFYNLMEKQSSSLTGQIANLEDAWDTVLNDWGEAGQDLFSTAISGATYFVEHMDDVLRIVKAITIAYGSYKAAMILTSVAMKGQFGIAVLDNTVRAAKIALLQKETILDGKLAVSQNAETISTQATTAALEAMLSAEERANIAKQVRIGAIVSLLSAQQQEYLSTLGLTVASEGYEAAAIGVMNTDQRAALSKINLTTHSAAYRTALTQEVAAKRTNQAATLESMRLSVKEAAAKAESARMDAIKAKSALEAAQMELHRAQTTAGVDDYLIAKKKLEAAEDNAALTRKAALAAQSDFYAKKKALETAATQASRNASVADTAAKTTQAASTNILSLATSKLTVMFKTLWATIKANPLGWLLTIAGAVYSVITMLSSKTEENKDAMSEFGEETKKINSQLKLYFSVLKNTDKESKTHKDALEKINALCQEYNQTLLTENDTLEQQTLKYQQLTKAIKENTAQKVIAKATEEAGEKLENANDEEFTRFKKYLKGASYWKKTDNMVGGYSVSAKNVRNMDDEVLDMVHSETQFAAQELSKLSGANFDKAFQEKLTNITAAASEAAGITGEEVGVLELHIKESLKRTIGFYSEFDKTITNVSASAERFYGKLEEKPETNATDYAQMSFKDLDALVASTQKEIDEMNKKKVKIDTDDKKLKELLATLGLIKKTISTKEQDLNTEEGISNRIKQLKDDRSTMQKFNKDGTLNKDWIEKGKTIEKLQKRLNQGNSKGDNEANKAEKNAETLRQKQLEADRRLEEARISNLEEGYEKRRATLDLQHKQALAQIDKEEKELAKARKEAGKGSLTAEEKQNFEQRRSYENESYNKSQAKLFDGELDYKKKQYELYWRWVENMGEDVANKQFENLLKSGSSYNDYISKQIAELESKKADGTITEGESNHLISLKTEYDDITGEKSKLDKFNESVSTAIQRSSTLAEKLEAVAKAKKKVENGESGLNADDKVTAYSSLTQQEVELQKELETTVLTDYRTFEEQRKSIQEEYALLRTEAQRIGDKERVRLINQGENEALSALNASLLMQSESWKNLFSDLDALTVDEIDKLITDIQTKMNTADLKLNPADLKAVLDRLDEARQKVLDTNPFKAMGRAISDVFKTSENGAKKSTKQIKTDWKNLASATEGCFNFVNEAVDSCSVLSDLLGETGKNTIQMLQGMAMAGIAMASAIKTAEKGSIILTAISIALQAISWIATLFNNDAKYEKKIQNLQRDIDALERSCNRLKEAFDRTYWVFNDEEKAAYEQQIQYIEQQIEAQKRQAEIAARAWNFAGYTQAITQIKKLNKELANAKEGGDMLSIYEAQKEALLEQQELIKEQIQNEQKKKKTDKDKIIQWQNAIEDIDNQLAEMERQMIETFAGTTTKEAIDQYADAIVDAYCAGEDAAKALGDTTREVLKKAVIDALKRKFLAKAMDEAVNFLGEAMSDGVLTKEEKEQFEYLTKKAGETFNNALEAVGDWIKDIDEDTISDPLAGAVAAMSEETAGVIAGRLNAFIINQTDQTNILREQLLAQSEIAKNTATANNILSNIESVLKRIENKDNSLLSQGIS